MEARLVQYLAGKWKIFDTQFPNAWSGAITITPSLKYDCAGYMGINGFNSGKAEVIGTIMTLGPYEFDLSTLETGKIHTTKNAGLRTMGFVK